MAVVFLGLGSNLGDRKKNLLSALKALEHIGLKIIKVSTIIETSPMGGPIQGKYLNAVAKAQTEFSPMDLLRFLKDIEGRMGRVKTVLNGPRIIDIDILLYDSLKLSTPHLTIPHPRMFERDFVMTSLKEIEPHLLVEFLKCK